MKGAVRVLGADAAELQSVEPRTGQRSRDRYELEVGIAESTSPMKRRGWLDEMLRIVRLLSFDRAAADASARIRRELEASSTPIGPIDTTIAGTLRAAGTALVPRNVKECQSSPELQVLVWF